VSARAALTRAAPGPPDCTRPVLPFTNAYAEPVPNATGLTAIVMVGDEILSGHTQDTNSSMLARLAFAAGRPVAHIEVVADDPPAIVAAIRRAIDTPEISRIAVCGGIGPTPDDRTFHAVADALGRPLELNPVAFANIEALAGLILTIEDELKQKEFSDPIGALYAAQDGFHTQIAAVIESYEAKCESLKPSA